MKRLFFIFIFTVGWSFFVLPVEAMTVFSPIIELEAKPGESVRGLVKLFNESTDDLVLTSSIEAFAAGDETGQPVYLPPEARHDFLNWFSLDESAVVLTPRQVALVPFTVKVPFDAVPGGYYGVIFWQTEATDDGLAPIAINSRVGTLVFLKVQGAVQEQGEILTFEVKNQNNIFFELPVDFQIRFANQGNIHLSPNGTIKLQNLIGQKHYLSINSEKRNVLPQSIRLFEVVWGSSGNNHNLISNFLSKLSQEFKYLALGPHTATLELTYGFDQPQNAVRSVSFWVWPWRLMITAVAALLLIIFLIRLNGKVNHLKRGLAKKNDDQQ